MFYTIYNVSKGEIMFDDEFQKRLYHLRTQKGVSARDMSLSIGQNPNYINFIESGRAMPSMSVFLSICDYLKITPSEFFNTENSQPEKLRTAIKNLQKLNTEKFDNITAVIANLAN